MSSIVKFLFFALVGLIILTLAIPLLWLVINMVTWLFGGSIASMGCDAGYFVIVVCCVIFIIWALATWNG